MSYILVLILGISLGVLGRKKVEAKLKKVEKHIKRKKL